MQFDIISPSMRASSIGSSQSRKTSQIGELMFKIILIGDSNTGKSCIMNRYVKDAFSDNYQATVGTEFAAKVIKMDDNYQVKLQIWDTAGQETFRSIIKTFFRNSGAVLLVYKIVSRKSFQSLISWLHHAKEHSPASAIFVLIGTHLDLEEKREVTTVEAERWMQENQINMFFETSAKTDVNVTRAFEEVAKQLFVVQLNKRRLSQWDLEKSKSIVALEAAKQEKKKCCLA